VSESNDRMTKKRERTSDSRKWMITIRQWDCRSSKSVRSEKGANTNLSKEICRRDPITIKITDPCLHRGHLRSASVIQTS